MAPFRNNGWPFLSKLEALIPPVARGLGAHRPHLAPSFASSDKAPVSDDEDDEQISLIQSIDTRTSDPLDKGKAPESNPNIPSLPTPSVSISSKRKYSAVHDPTTSSTQDSDRRSSKSGRSSKSAPAASSSSAVSIDAHSTFSTSNLIPSKAVASGSASRSGAKSAKSVSTVDSNTSRALGELTAAFKLSLTSAVVDPMSHNQMEAANAVMDDDNGLTDDQKAMMIALFAKDPGLADMYCVVRRNKNIMASFLRNTLGLPALELPAPPSE